MSMYPVECPTCGAEAVYTGGRVHCRHCEGPPAPSAPTPTNQPQSSVAPSPAQVAPQPPTARPLTLQRSRRWFVRPLPIAIACSAILALGAMLVVFGPKKLPFISSDISVITQYLRARKGKVRIIESWPRESLEGARTLEFGQFWSAINTDCDGCGKYGVRVVYDIDVGFGRTRRQDEVFFLTEDGEVSGSIDTKLIRINYSKSESPSDFRKVQKEIEGFFGNSEGTDRLERLKEELKASEQASERHSHDNVVIEGGSITGDGDEPIRLSDEEKTKLKGELTDEQLEQVQKELQEFFGTPPKD